MELWLPYGEAEIPVKIPDDNFYRIIEPVNLRTGKNTTLLVNDALDNPIGGFSLTDMVKPRGLAGIIVDPIVPVDVWREAVRVLSSRLLALGVEKTKIFFRRRLSCGTDVPSDYRLFDPSQNSFTEIGRTTRGTYVDVDPELMSCETKVSIGLVMPHFASGFTGGPEAVIPASSSLRSTTRNRSLIMKGSSDLQSPTENPLLADSFEAYRLAGPFFSLDFVPDGWGGISSAHAGELEAVFREAVQRFAETHMPKIERRSDIALVSAGSFLGADLYHAVRVVSNIIRAVKREGTVILVAECSKGIGDPVFLDYARRFREKKDLLAELRYRFKLGAHVDLFLREALEKCRIQLVSVLPELFARDLFNLRPSQTASEAVQKAIRMEGKESKVLIVPKGEVTVPIMESS